MLMIMTHTTSALHGHIMRHHIQHSHRAYGTVRPHYGSRYYLGVAACLIAIGLLYLAWSLWLVRQ
ncbi:hypothetical protein D7091_13075 [Ralstonia pickettii]|nr:hypothetical protein [Ralstonia pickettii]MBA9877807.1 hypothetical protein [Ralstonia pickettii]MBA9887616.1 hypothetical protein [Ralstonia pickettii]MBA9892595.1 hypothetical protein [Ralstonia pickettii]MBB0029569.1 hypothetical protein [Ralstonia pickettii]